MQRDFDKIKQLKFLIGKNFKRIREEKKFNSLNDFARSYDINRANLSKIENGKVGCSIETAWRISEALGVPLSVFIKQIEDQVGKDFKLMDE